MSDRTVLSPSISALGGATRRLSSLLVTTETYIQITAESPELAIYFTTDGSDPTPPGHRASHNASGQTHRYRAPFKLKAGLSRIVSAIAISSRGIQSTVMTELFDVRSANYNGLQLEDDSSIPDADSSFASTDDTYTLNDDIRRWPSPSTGDDFTEISVSDIYFSPRGRVYSRIPNTARELDTYFETKPVRNAGRYRGLTLKAWEDEGEGGWTSNESDGDSEVTNYFRLSRRPQNNDTRLSCSMNCGRERGGSPSLEGRKPEYFTNGGHLQYGYESPRSALVSRLSPAHMEDHSKHTRFLGSSRGEYSPRAGRYTDRTYTVDHNSSIARGPAMTSRGKEDGRLTPVSDIGYNLGYKYGGEASDFSDDVITDRSSSSRQRKVKAGVRKTPDEVPVNRKKFGDEASRNKWNKSGVRKTMATDEDAMSSSSSNSSSRSEKSDKKSDKKNYEKSDKKSDKQSDKKSDKQSDKKSSKKCCASKEPPATSAPLGEVAASNGHIRGSNPMMSFVNDSGTQINLWGMEAGEVLQQLGTNIHAMTERGKQPRPDDSRAAAVEAGPTPNISHHDQIVDPVAPPVAKIEQVSQHSIGDKFCNFFGVGSKSKKNKSKAKLKGRGDGEEETYEVIVKRCLEEGCLWEDSCFPACDDSLYFQEKPSVWPVEWKRPHEICADPELFVGGASRFDVIQGILGNCWLLAAVASLSSVEKLLHQVVPPDQSFTEGYAGVFRFRFWQYGQWLEVCVDDQLPTKNGQLIYMHSRQTNEFWTPLLEKAYAKMNACYETLSGGLTSEAMTDFTGGVVEKFNFRDELPSNMFTIMLKACDRGSLLGCSIDASGGAMEEELENGLLRGHAYSITAVRASPGQRLQNGEVDTKTGSEEIVRVRNPWGNECEWKGAWSDKSKEWQNLSSKGQESLGLTFDHDGEFWMSYRDFSTHFQRVEICNIQPDSAGSDDIKGWQYTLKDGSWTRNVNAGGCRNNPATFWINPQFKVSIMDADDDDEEDIGTIIIGLMQQSRRKLRSQGYNNLTIGYEVFEIPRENESGPLDQEFFRRSRPVTSSPTYINTREVCGRHRLTPGRYCIVPTTFDMNEEAEFIIRIFSEKPSDFVEVDENTAVVQAKREAPVNSAPNVTLRSEAEVKFKEYGGEDLEVDAFELQDILNSVFTKDFKFASFDTNLCRSIVALKDSDHTGRLSFDEFQDVWTLLHSLKATFKQYDKDHSGSFNSYEIREALKAVGYKLSNSAFNSAVMRYSDKDGSIKFDDFVACVVRLNTLFDVFNNASDGDSVKLNLDYFIKMALYS